MRLRSIARTGAAAAGAAAGVYAANAVLTFARFGRPRQPDADEANELLDGFMPVYHVVERHHVRVNAPAAVTLAAAKESDLFDMPPARAIFKAREIVMRSAPDTVERPKGMLALTTSLGWTILAETPDREVVVGAVTKPWEPNPTFRSIPAPEFAAFDEPDYVKIVWTLRADAIDPGACIFRTETRAVATDAEARRRFRRYWALVSPGIWMLRRLSLAPLKNFAEKRNLELETEN